MIASGHMFYVRMHMYVYVVVVCVALTSCIDVSSFKSLQKKTQRKTHQVSMMPVAVGVERSPLYDSLYLDSSVDALPDMTAEVVDLLQRHYVDASQVTDMHLQRLSAQILCDTLSCRDRDKHGSSLQHLSQVVSALDSYSRLLWGKTYEDFKREHAGWLAGVGIRVGVVDGSWFIDEVYPDSPAKEHGLQRGDRIIAVSDQPTAGITLGELSPMMTGLPGSVLSIVVVSRDKQRRLLHLKRRLLAVESVRLKWFDSTGKELSVFDGETSYMYLGIDHFRSGIAENITRMWQDISRSKKDVLGIIVDLRGNPGGLLSEAVKLVDMFVDEGVIVATTLRGMIDHIYRARKKTTLFDDISVVVLMDEGAASASEIVSHALQRHRRGWVMGRPSFGKSSIQSLFEISEHVALKLTVGHYFVPAFLPPSRDVPFVQGEQPPFVMPDVWVMPYKNVSSSDETLQRMWQHPPQKQWLTFVADGPDSARDKACAPAHHHQTEYVYVSAASPYAHKQDDMEADKLTKLALAYLDGSSYEHVSELHMSHMQQVGFKKEYVASKTACEGLQWDIEVLSSEEKPLVQVIVENQGQRRSHLSLLGFYKEARYSQSDEKAIKSEAVGYLLGDIPAFSKQVFYVPYNHSGKLTFYLASYHRYVLASKQFHIPSFLSSSQQVRL
ncbi:MAG: S41 family peptidase [Proteobacteria bacterium]|nr:S41 family peptidase [Pseudomonadota bacterium]